MYRSVLILITVLFNLAFIDIREQPEEQEAFIGYEWVLDIFEKAEIARVQYAPNEIQDLPLQLKELGLDQDNILFGRKFASFDQFRQVFEEAEAYNPVKADSLTSWDLSWHQGVSVYSKVYQIENRGIVIAFYSPNIIVADLGPSEESVKLRDILVEKNK